MPGLSKRNQQRFNGLRDQTTAAIKTVNKQLIAAAQANDEVKVQSLATKLSDLNIAMVDIGKAELAFIRSSMTVSQAETELRSASQRARKAVDDMKTISKTLNKVAEFVNVIANLVGAFA